MSGAALWGRKVIVVTAELVSLIGAHNAIVLQQVQWWSLESRKSDDGWVTMSLVELAKSTGLSRSSLQRSLAWLRDHQYVLANGGNGVELTYSIAPAALALGTTGTGAKTDRSDTKVKRSPIQKRTGSGVGTTSKGEQDLENVEDAANAAAPRPGGLFEEPRDQETPPRAETENARDPKARAVDGGPGTEAWRIGRKCAEVRLPKPKMGPKQLAEMAQSFIDAGRAVHLVHDAMLEAPGPSQAAVEVWFSQRDRARPRNARAGSWSEKQSTGEVRRGVWSDD